MTMTDEKQDCFVSLVSVMQDSAESIAPFLRSAHAILSRSFSDYEIVLIDQRSTDATIPTVEVLLREIPSVRLIELSARVHPDTALAAGIENAIGDFVLLMVPGVDPPESIPDLVRKCREGCDVVFGVTAELPQTLPCRLLRRALQSVRDLVGYDLPWNATTLRCLSRRAVNAVTVTGRFHHQFFFRIARTGYPASPYPYVPNLSSLDRLTLSGAFRQTVRLLVFNSTRPLRWMSLLGLLGSFMAGVFALYSLAVHFFVRHVVEGWTTLVLFMSFLFMLLFAILAFFGEYLGRLLDERSDQGDYSVVYEKHSSVMLDGDRVNVLHDADSHDVNAVQTGRDR